MIRSSQIIYLHYRWFYALVGGRTKQKYQASILYKFIAGRYRPVSYPDGPITARYRFIKNAYWESVPVVQHSVTYISIFSDASI